MVLKHQAMKGQEWFCASHWLLSLKQLSQKITGAYADYYQIKAQCEARDTWIGQLLAAQATVLNVPKRNYGNNSDNRRLSKKQHHKLNKH